MKKIIMIAVVGIIVTIIATIVYIFSALGINPLINWNEKIKNDYDNHFTLFEDIVTSVGSEHIYIRSDEDDTLKSVNTNYETLFEELNYFFISGNEDKLLFCKTMDGAVAVGILYIKDPNYWKPNPKQKVIEILDEEGHWILFSENYL